MHIVLHPIRVQLCFVSKMRLRIHGLDLHIQHQRDIGLVILTCYHMEEGKVPSSINGSQDAHLPTLIGHQVSQTMAVERKIG